MLNGAVEDARDTYVNANLILRPGRVAILFRGGGGGGGWQPRARLAISVAGKYWGGSGFILVPFDDSGAVSASVLALVEAYDPDHVVLMRLSSEERERVGEFDWSDRRAQNARATVANACTPFHRAPSDDTDAREQVTYLEYEPGPMSGQLVSSAGINDRYVTVACSENWNADSSMALAIRTGVLPRGQETRSSEERREPGGIEVVPFLFNPQRWSRDLGGTLEEALSVNDQGLGPWPRLLFDEPDGGLALMSFGFPTDGAAIVVGDSADDFATAYAYERMLGFGVWLTPSMITDPTMAMHIGGAYRGAAQAVAGAAKQLTISSVSLTDEELEQLLDVFREDANSLNPFGQGLPGTHRPTRALPQGVRIGPPRINAGHWQRTVSDPTMKRLSVPVSIESDGTATMRAPLESPFPATLLQQQGSPMPYWYVSVDFPEVHMPKARGVPQEFTAHSSDQSHVPVRSSRDGLSFHSRTGGLVVYGMQLNALMQEPRLRILGVHRWAQAMARRTGMDAQLSQPGMNARQVELRLSGRDQLISLVAGAFHPALMRFATLKDRDGNTATGIKSRTEFPDNDGVVLDGDPYLSFESLRKIVHPIREEELRGWIDRLSGAALLRRGFVLNCRECGRASFVSLESSSQRFECARCSAVNELTAERWRVGNEPGWFYDLHPSFRELLADHGDVGLLAAHRIRARSQRYSDTAEMEFRSKGTPICEIDLIAHADSEVIVVEAKSNNRLGSTRKQVNEAARKKVAIAAALRADRLILATSQPIWAEGTIRALESAKSNEPSAANIVIEVMTGLGPELPEQELSYEI